MKTKLLERNRKTGKMVWILAQERLLNNKIIKAFTFLKYSSPHFGIPEKSEKGL